MVFLFYAQLKFNNMRKVLIVGLSRLKPIGRANCFLFGRNVFLFNTKQNSFFKKKEIVVPEILKDEDLQQEAQEPKDQERQKKEQLKDLLNNYEHYFTQQLHNIPLYLQRLSKSLDEKISANDLSKLQDIYSKINKCTSDLSLKPIQYLQILIFIEKYTKIVSKYPIRPVMASNDFEIRATMTTATFLLNKSLTVTQAVALFKIFTSIGSLSPLFLANFTKFLKIQFQNDSSKTNIKLEHILAILSNYFLKNNRTILQNVLYDMTLNHLLSNPYLISESSSPSLLVQLFTYLLRIDLRYFYLSQQRELTSFLKNLTQKVLLYYNSKQNTINSIIFCSVYLLESCDYYLSSKHKNIEIQALAEKIINQVYKKYKTGPIRQSKEKMFSRILFNKRLFKMNVDFAQIVLKITEGMINQESLYPLIDRFYDGDQQNRALQLLRKIFQSKKHVFLPATSKIVLSVSTHEEIDTFWKEIIEGSKQVWLKNQLFLFSLLSYSNQKYPNIFNDSQIKQFYDRLKQKVISLSQNKYDFILSLYEAIYLYRDIDSCSSWLLQIISLISFQQFLTITLSKQSENESHQVRYISIAALLLSIQPSLTVPEKFNDKSMYTYLRTLYPLNHSTKEYSKPIHFLQSDENFKRNMEVVIRLAGNFEKYSYLLWDIFINNYIQKSQNVRAACFDLLKSFFSKAFEKQAARRIVLLFNLTNYMSSQVIIASKSKLKQLFEYFLRPLVDQDIHEKFHYHCFLQLTFNALSLGILTNQSFTKIIKRCLAADKCIPSSYKTSSLLLFYGMTMKNSDNIYSQFYFQQRKYIKYLLDKQLIKFTTESLSKEKQQISKIINKKYVTVGSKFLCILLQYGQHQLLNISQEILTFVRSNSYFTEILQLHNSFHPELYDLKDKNLHKFASSLNSVLQKKIDAFYIMKLIGKDTHDEVIAKLAENHKVISLFIQ